MKIKKRAPEEAPVPVVQLDELAESIETRITRLSEEAAHLDVKLTRFAQLTEEELRRRGNAFMEVIDRRMAMAEQEIVYRVLDYINNCPQQDLLKIQESDVQKSDASRLFAEKLRSGWKYIGYYTNPTNPADRYTLMIRGKTGPVTDAQYLKFYEEYQARRTKMLAEEKNRKTTSSEPEAEEETPVASKPLPKVKLKAKVTKK